MTWILDIEANGLWPEVSKIWCAVARCVETDEVVCFEPDGLLTVEDIPSFMGKEAEKGFSCHNGIGYDLKVLKKILNYEYKGKYEDTLLMSRILWPDIEAVPGIKGPHGIEAWGERFGVSKPEHEDWSQYSEEMLHRCIEDTKIQAKLYKYIQEHVDSISMSDKRVDFSQAFRLEHKVWRIIEQQCDNGWTLDIDKAFKVQDLIKDTYDEIEEKLIKSLPLRVIKPKTEVTKAFKADSEITENAKKWFKNIDEDKLKVELCGDFCKVQFVNTNPGSSEQVKDYLLNNGWKPSAYNFKKDRFNKAIKDGNGQKVKTSPKIPKGSEEWELLAELTDNENVKLISHFYVLRHRLGLVKGFIENYNVTTGKVYPSVNTCSTNTARMSHKIIVNVPKAEESVLFGKELRSLFTASPGRIMVGCDASAIEARVEAHYLWDLDRENAKELIEGDIHKKNMYTFGFDPKNEEELKLYRGRAKSLKYAIGYGCGVAKLASMLNCSNTRAKELLNEYWEKNRGLKELKEKLSESFSKRGYILSIDKRPLTVRYEHALINTLFQSAGSIIMKVALCILNSRIVNENLDSLFVGNYHDEMQSDVAVKDARRVAILSRQSITEAGEYFKLSVALDGESKVGDNWAIVH